MLAAPGRASNTGGTSASPMSSPSPDALKWLIGLRLVVVTTLLLGVLVVQLNTQQILPLRDFYALILIAYGCSLVYLVLYLRKPSTHLQAITQLGGDLALVTGLVYFTGGVASPFSFLYLTVIVVAAVMLRGGGLVFAGLSAMTYGVLVDLMVFDLIPIPTNLVGVRIPVSSSRVLYQLTIHIGGFVLVALLVSYLTESLRTARHRLEEEQKRSTRLLALTQHVVRSVGAGIVACDLDGLVLYINPAAERILQIGDAESALNRSIEEVLPLEGQNWGLLRARVRHRGSVRIEGRHLATSRRLGLTLGPLQDETGSVVGFIINFQDLSEVEVEQERRRLQERMAAVGEMASRMAHEIRNPLASISGSAQMLTSTSELGDTGGRLLDIVVTESQRLSRILEGFLAYSKPSHSDHGPVDVAVLMRDCLTLLEKSKELGPHHRLVDELPESLTIIGDENLLRQIAWNLARNALQAMPDGGTLTIRGEWSPVGVRLHWQDTGKGMTEDVRQRAFEPFVTTHPGGTGLGLAVVYAAVQDHGGEVTIETQPGVGTVVTVELPGRAGDPS